MRKLRSGISVIDFCFIAMIIGFLFMAVDMIRCGKLSDLVLAIAIFGPMARLHE